MGALLFVAALSSAQDFRATLTGIVTDPTGAVTPNADVVAIERDTQQKYTATTNPKGEYALAYMLPGTYSVSVTAPGFRIKEQSGVLLQANDTLALNFQMELGTAAQKIEITAAPPLLESATGSNNNIISSKEIEDSPLNGRQIYMLIGTTPGSEFLQTQFGSSGYSGTRGWDNSNNYTLGGGVQGYQQFQLNGSNITVQTSYQSQGQGTWQIAPNVGALQEVNVMTSTYDARYGRTGGGTMNMVVKSGTNAIHGSAYDYLENGHLNANNFQNNLTGFPRSMVHQNQFGGTAGGHIKRDKIFLFASYEGYRQAIPFTTIASVPQASIHPSSAGANFTGSGYAIYDPATTACSGPGTLDNCPSGTYTRQAFPGSTIPANRITALGEKVLSLYPAPNLPGTAQNFIMAAPDRYSYNQPMARLDFDTSASTRWYTLFAYQLGQEYRNTNGLPPPAERGNIAHTRGNVTASQDMTHIFSPSLLADFKLSFARFIDFASDGDLNSQPLDPTSFGLNMPAVPTRSKSDFPEISLSSYATAIGNSVTDDVWQNIVFDNEWTKMLSHHTLHFGGEVARFQFADPNTVGNPNGVFDFSGVYTQGNPLKGVTGQGSSVADLLLGFPDSGHVDWNTTILDYNPTYSLYIQDDWKALRKLTLNIGLRYDVQVGTKERHNQLNRGMCLACVNPVTTNPQYQANLAADASALAAAHIDPASLATIYGGILFAGVNGQPRDAYNTDWSNVQPRFGFAYALDSRTVLRGGYGIQYAIGLEGGTADGYSVATPYVASQNNNVTPADYFASGTPYPFGVQVAAGASQGLLTGIGNTAQLDFPQRRIPRSQITSFGIQRALPFGLLLDARYAGNFTDRLRVSVWLNGTMPYSQYQLAVQNANYFNQQVPNPYYGILPPSSTMGQKTVPAEYLMTPFTEFRLVGSYDDPLGRQWYNGLEVKLNKQFSHGLFYRLSYTYSKTMQANNYINGWPYQDAELKRQIAGSDRTHRLAVTGAYELPMGKGKTLFNSGKAVNAIAGGWNLSWVFSKYTGTPVGLNASYNYICDHGFAPNSGPTFHNYFYAPAGKSAGACYSHLGTFQLYTGTNRTGSVRNPVIPNIDVSMQKNVRINERYRLQFRADAFNLANTVLFGGPDTNPGDVVNVSSTGVWSGFGTVGITQYNFPRVIQLSLKFYF